MALSNDELLRKSTETNAFTTDAMTGQGTALSIEQVKTFLRLALTPTAMVRDVRNVQSNAPKWQEAHLDMSGRVLHGGNQGVRTDSTKQKAPETEMVEINTVLLRGEVPIADEVMEDNFEQDGFGNSVMTMIAEAAGRDVEELMINGDTTNTGDDLLKLTDGWLKLCQDTGIGANTPVDGSVTGTDYQKLFLTMLRTLPAKYKRDKPNMRFYVPVQVEETYRAQLAGRGTPLGDAQLGGTDTLTFQGVAIVPVALIAVDDDAKTSTVLLAHRNNLYAGFQRQIKLETWRDPREGATSWVVSARVDAEVGHAAATVVAIDVPTE